MDTSDRSWLDFGLGRVTCIKWSCFSIDAGNRLKVLCIDCYFAQLRHHVLY